MGCSSQRTKPGSPVCSLFPALPFVLPLQAQQRLLNGQAAAIAHQSSAAADDPVAGREDGNRVRSVGVGHGTDSGRPPYAPGYFAVGDGLPVWNIHKLLPDAFLERAACEQERQVERFPLSEEVFIQLASGCLGDIRGLGHVAGRQLGLQPSVHTARVFPLSPVAEAELVVERT